MRLRMTVTLECTVCLQYWDDDQARESRRIAAFVGSIDFGTCPQCGQGVENYRDTEYRRRVRHFISKRRPEVVITCYSCSRQDTASTVERGQWFAGCNGHIYCKDCYNEHCYLEPLDSYKFVSATATRIGQEVIEKEGTSNA